jgi:hypothetical protein
MKKYLITVAVATLTLASTSSAAITVSLSGSPTSGPVFFTGANGNTTVPAGSLLRIGTFDTPPAADLTFAEYALSFKEFARTTMGNTAGTDNGRVNRPNIGGGNDVNSPLPDSDFAGKTI